MYDIIGDIHGDAAGLRALLHRMEYQETNGCYRHANRKAIFLGDFINKGKATYEVWHMVKNMQEQQQAYAVAGNHEWYLLSYFTKNKAGHYIREHSPENTQQLQPTLLSFQEHASEWPLFLAWLKTLPLFLELKDFRVAHAFWHTRSIRYLQQHYPEGCLSDRLLCQMQTLQSPEWKAVHALLVGHALQLPPSAGGAAFKTKWWCLGKTERYEILAVRPEEDKKGFLVPVTPKEIQEYSYTDKKPLFFGHYNLPAVPYLTGTQHACVDFSVDGKKIITAYRWQGEQQLNAAHLLH